MSENEIQEISTIKFCMPTLQGEPVYKTYRYVPYGDYIKHSSTFQTIGYEINENSTIGNIVEYLDNNDNFQQCKDIILQITINLEKYPKMALDTNHSSGNMILIISTFSAKDNEDNNILLKSINSYYYGDNTDAPIAYFSYTSEGWQKIFPFTSEE